MVFKYFKVALTQIHLVINFERNFAVFANMKLKIHLEITEFTCKIITIQRFFIVYIQLLLKSSASHDHVLDDF